MHTIIGKIVRFCLWLLSSLIILLLLIGLAKFNRNMGNYIGFLNARDWQIARGQLSISHPSSFGYMFRGNGSREISSGVILSGNVLSGELLSGDALTGTDTGLNAYDPSLENDLNNIPTDTLSGDGSSDSGFGFTGSDTTTPSSSSGDTNAEMLNRIGESLQSGNNSGLNTQQ